MDLQRRALVAAGGALLLPACATGAAMSAPTSFDVMPPLPETPTPGQPGDFDFLTGEWRVHNRSIVNGEWLEYPGEATVHAILAGVGSVEELRIPARNFSGMGLRLLDVEKRVWADHWVNARSGVVTVPGQLGSFENGAGIFITDDVADGAPVKYVGVWDNITPRSCRWRQASSRDGGQTWDQNWIMEWSRV
ncbi:MAG: hypothetical protein IPG56_14135 [Caulobacteraceae bacterium]|jgi:hypothetical protein|nr:hypothetical protein [Caulobacteraceae bacterium]